MRPVSARVVLADTELDDALDTELDDALDTELDDALDTELDDALDTEPDPDPLAPWAVLLGATTAALAAGASSTSST
jgi:hypothetical protein